MVWPLPSSERMFGRRGGGRVTASQVSRDAIDVFVPTSIPSRYWHLIRPAWHTWMLRLHDAGVADQSTLVYTARYLHHAIRNNWWDPGSGGLPPLDAVSIDLFCRTALEDLTVKTRGTVRSRLRRAVRHTDPATIGPKPDVYYQQTTTSAPYTDAELGLLDTLAVNIRTLRSDHRPETLIVLGAGAGLAATDLRHVHGHHITAGDDGIVTVDITDGPRPRMVPIRHRYANRALSIAGQVGDGHVLGGDGGRHNLVSEITRVYNRHSPIPLKATRLRNTWLHSLLAAQVPVDVIVAAAGVGSLDLIGQLIANTPPPDPAVARPLLAGSPPASQDRPGGWSGGGL